ncbi:hypothetical protein J6590_007705 [Homalodisca vitripennis]|nr:hypothetical protein J6590_007705 [Homalodisca vitripennis]
MWENRTGQEKVNSESPTSGTALKNSNLIGVTVCVNIRRVKWSAVNVLADETRSEGRLTQGKEDERHRPRKVSESDIWVAGKEMRPDCRFRHV